MIWSQSSAGLALTSMFHEGRSTAKWLRHGWHVVAVLVCVIVGLACCLLAGVAILRARRRLDPLTMLWILAASPCVLLGGLCVAGGAFMDRDIPSVEEMTKPLPRRAPAPLHR